MSVLVNIVTTYNGAGAKRAMRDLSLMQKQAALSGQRMSGSMLAASASMRRVGASTAAVGASMSKRLSLPLVAVGVVSLKMAADFEKSMKLIQTQAGGSAADVRELSAAVLKLAPSGEHGPTELSNALYHLKSVGMENADAMKALKIASEGASVGQADLEATTNALAGAWRVGVAGATTFKEAMGTINAVVGAGNLRMEDLNAALGTGILTTAKTFGVSLQSVGASIALFTAQGQPAAQSATRLRMAMSMMAAPTDKAKEALADIGLKSTDLAKALRKGGISEAIGLLREKMKGLSEIKQGQLLAAAFGGARGGGTIMALVNGYDTLLDKEKQIAKNTGKFDKLVTANADRLSAKWENLKATLSTSAIQIGNALMPAATAMVRDLKRVGDAFSRLDSGTRTWIVKLGVAAAVAGPLLVVVGKLAVGIGRLVGVVAKITLAFGKGAAAAPKYARAIAGATKAVAGFARSLVTTTARMVRSAAVWIAQAAKAAARQVAAAARASSAWAASATRTIAAWTRQAAAAAASAARQAAAWVGSAARAAAAQVAAAGRMAAAWVASTAKTIAAWTRQAAVATAIAAKQAAAWAAETAAKVAATAATIAHSAATKASAAAQWLLNIALTANPIGLVVVAIAALVAAFIIAYKKSERFRKIVTGAWNAIKRATVTVFNWIVGFFKKWGTLIVRVLIGPMGNLVILLVKNWQRIRDGAVGAFNSIVSYAAGLPGRILSAVGSGAKLLYGFGADVLRGVWNGMSSIAGWLKDKVYSFFKNLLPGWAKKALGISSPSKVFAEVGKNIGLGMALGMDGTHPMVRRAAQALAGAALPAFGGPGGFRGAGGGYGRSGAVVISRGAVQVEITVGAGVRPGEVKTAARSGLEQALVKLAREINAT